MNKKKKDELILNVYKVLNEIKQIPFKIEKDISLLEQDIINYFEEHHYQVCLEKDYLFFITMECYKKNIQNKCQNLENELKKILHCFEENELKKITETQISIVINTIKENINKTFENTNIDDIINNEINAVIIRHTNDLMFSKNIMKIRKDLYEIIRIHGNKIQTNISKIVEKDVNELLIQKKEEKVIKPYTVFKYGFLTASIVIGAFISFRLYLSFEDTQNTHNVLESVSTKVNLGKQNLNIASTQNTKTEMQKLKEINSDAVAWIKINGTKINHSVVKAKDNTFYLNHNIYKDYNENGWAFMDYRNSGNFDDRNTVIYAHNTDVMFASLRNTLNKDWQQVKENRKITVITEKETLTFEVFSTYTTKVEDYYIRTQFTDNEFKTFIKTIKNRSIYNYGVEVSVNDKILTLSTCNRGLKNGRTVLHAKRIT